MQPGNQINQPLGVFKAKGAEIDILSHSGREDVAEVFVGAMRNSHKYCIEFVDGLDTRFPREDKWIINISTQFGCPVGCAFCDAGGEYHGNLTADEMLAQVEFIMGRHPELVSTCGKLKVHFARMGEPALNPAVPDAIAALPAMGGNPNLWCCVATIAPAGQEDWFERLLQAKNEHFRGRFQLQFSINSTDEESRKRLMPYRAWSMEQVAAYGERFFDAGDRRVVLNFALAGGIPFEPKDINRHFDPRCFAVKLSPVNPTYRGGMAGLETVLRSEAEGRLEEDISFLAGKGYDVVVSVGDGREDEIGSNCGQAVLRQREMQEAQRR